MLYGKPFPKNGKWCDIPEKEAQLHQENLLGFPDQAIRDKLRDWWLVATRTPNWDIASTCKIDGKSGLLLIEAKAHANELSYLGKNPPGASPNSKRNHEQIKRAIEEAADGLALASGKPWSISWKSHYQLSNRFAWAWKLASLSVPVVLGYLGFLNARDMANDGPLFGSRADWERVLKTYSGGVVDNSCWGNAWTSTGRP